MLLMYRAHFIGIIVLFISILLTPSLLFAAPVEIVNNTNDSGVDSLRQAITDVDIGGEIIFDLPGSGPDTIFISSPLEIDKSMTISGPGESLLTICLGVE